MIVAQRHTISAATTRAARVHLLLFIVAHRVHHRIIRSERATVRLVVSIQSEASVRAVMRRHFKAIVVRVAVAELIRRLEVKRIVKFGVQVV